MPRAVEISRRQPGGWAPAPHGPALRAANSSPPCVATSNEPATATAPSFRAKKNGRGDPISYQSAHRRWATYSAKAGIAATLHQLRHTHATELVKDGVKWFASVSLQTTRKRLGHRNLQTTLRYAEQTGATADNQLRRWRRRKTTTR